MHERARDRLALRAGELRLDEALEFVLFRLERLAGPHDDRVKFAVLAADGDHAVRCSAVVVDRVARAELLDVRADLHAHLTLDDNIHLLALMGGELDRDVLLRLIVRHRDVERLGGLLLEQRREVQVLEAVAARDRQSLAAAGNRVGGKRRADALDEVGRVDAEALRTFVDEREAEIALAVFTPAVLLDGHAGPLRHLLLGKAHDVAHGADSLRHLRELRFEVRLFRSHRLCFVCQFDHSFPVFSKGEAVDPE